MGTEAFRQLSGPSAILFRWLKAVVCLGGRRSRRLAVYGKAAFDGNQQAALIYMPRIAEQLPR